ncbi:MAG: hypothetical protein A2096_10940 [Spirochaetes bacterium GWF1_41_5]|nr:MAG: hypothetical protein A2096_10940 [Spirochaetes bacterium GWF1_41_5]HBE01017.1 hypothetical protein [Spirochaetia bacterium]
MKNKFIFKVSILFILMFGIGQSGERRIPVLFVLPSGGPERNIVINAWNTRFGKAFDIISDAPLQDNLNDLTNIKTGLYCWSAPSFAEIKKSSFPDFIRCFLYDFEHWQYTPQSEQKDVYSTSKEIFAFCRDRGWRSAIIPMYRDGLALTKLAGCYDIYIVQCQKFQNDNKREEAVKYLREITEIIKKINPGCLVGCQVGMADQYGNGSAGSGLQTARALYDETKNFLGIYSIWWPPHGKYLLEFLEYMEK